MEVQIPPPIPRSEREVDMAEKEIELDGKIALEVIRKARAVNELLDRVKKEETKEVKDGRKD